MCIRHVRFYFLYAGFSQICRICSKTFPVLHEHPIKVILPHSTTVMRIHAGRDPGAMSLLAMMPRRPTMAVLTLPRPSKHA
jgi:hypothetical protein